MVWAVAGLTAFLVFPLGFGTEYLINLSPLVLKVSSRQSFPPPENYLKVARKRALNASLSILFAAQGN